MRQDTEIEIKKFFIKNLLILALGVSVLVVSVPLMTNYCIDGVDVSFYLRQLERGRMEDIFLVLPSVLIRMGMSTESAYKLLLSGLNFAAAGIAYVCFQRIFQDRMIGIVGSMLYTWTPYRLNDLYCRGDLGEAIALCFLPVILYGLYRVYQEDGDSQGYRRLWIVLTLGYTLIVQAYLLSFLITAGFTVLFCLVMWKKTFRRPVLIVLLKTVAAFLVCNAWLFILIFLRIREGTFSMAAFRGELIQSGGVYPSIFLQLFFINGSSYRTAGTGMEEIQPLGAGFAVTVGVLVYLWLVFVGRYRDQKDGKDLACFGKGIGITGAILAILSTNCFPWDYVQKRNGIFFRLVASLQSPARLMQVVTVCFVLLTCVALWQVKKWENSDVSRTFAIVIALTALLSVQYLTGDILSTGEPRSLYGVEYGEPEKDERFQPENLDISPWDYGKYEHIGR